MTPINWIARDILGLPHDPRQFPERRSGKWRALGWLAAASPWLLLVAFWWIS